MKVANTENIQIAVKSPKPSTKVKENKLFNIVNIIFMSLFALVIIFPIWDIVVASFSSPDTLRSSRLRIWPEEFSLENYKLVFNDPSIWNAFMISILKTVIGVATHVFFTAMVAYAMSKKDLLGRNVYTAMGIGTMFFSGGMIPDYLLVKNLGLLDNSLSLILPSAVNVFFIIIMRNYFMTIDKGIEESAIIDGANYFQILTKIIIPISKPVIATVALWAAVYHWNEWFHALVYIQDDAKTVLQIVVRDMLTAMDLSSNSSTSMGGGGMSGADLLLSNVRAATVIISIGPIVLIYPFVQKYFIKGIMIGSLKG